jgi:acyl-coenzyme A thioesterase PaaI-like protein
LRRVIRLTVGGEIDGANLDSAARSAASLADSLEAAAHPGVRFRPAPDIDGDPQDFFPTSPVIGFANPIAPPVEIEVVEGEIRGRVTFGDPYEGPPGHAHGGMLALVLDELLGAANLVAGLPCMTGTLTIEYRRPTPLHTPLVVQARNVRRDGRKIYSWGGIFLGNELTAEAEGIFISVSPQQFAEMAKRRAVPDHLAQIVGDVEQKVASRSADGRE